MIDTAVGGTISEGSYKGMWWPADQAPGIFSIAHTIRGALVFVPGVKKIHMSMQQQQYRKKSETQRRGLPTKEENGTLSSGLGGETNSTPRCKWIPQGQTENISGINPESSQCCGIILHMRGCVTLSAICPKCQKGTYLANSWMQSVSLLVFTLHTWLSRSKHDSGVGPSVVKNRTTCSYFIEKVCVHVDYFACLHA